jgi:hypothetical protein
MSGFAQLRLGKPASGTAHSDLFASIASALIRMERRLACER